MIRGGKLGYPRLRTHYSMMTTSPCAVGAGLIHTAVLDDLAG